MPKVWPHLRLLSVSRFRMELEGVHFASRAWLGCATLRIVPFFGVTTLPEWQPVAARYNGYEYVLEEDVGVRAAVSWYQSQARKTALRDVAEHPL
mmetsp:Transcript_74306/g.164089  ORF Transcript_74306/g.164089 Transcript_74306/m.164089 type:complete len:95 (-) Transcript_74306:111-395(-)